MIPVRVSFWYELSISYRVYMDDTNIDTGMTHEPKQYLEIQRMRQ